LYINDSRVGLINAYDVLDDGNIAHGRLFCVLKDERPGVPDGMKVDLDGNVYCTGPGGIWIIDPSGKHLGTIALGDGKRATNVGWGGEDWKTLFITTFHELACVRMNIAGVPVPRQI
jgi:gluconolactonase